MNLGCNSGNHENDFLQEKEECLENVTHFFSGLNLREVDGELSKDQISELICLAREKIREFLVSKCVYDIVPESSKIMAVSSNVPVVIAICFLLEDKKKSMVVYDENEDTLTGTFTCNDALLIFYVIHQLVLLEGKVLEKGGDCSKQKINEEAKTVERINKKDQQTNLDEDINAEHFKLPFSCLDDVSNCTLKSWMTEVLDVSCYKNLRLKTNDTLYDGVSVCLELDGSKKFLDLGSKKFQWKELGCWVLQDQETEDDDCDNGGHEIKVKCQEGEEIQGEDDQKEELEPVVKERKSSGRFSPDDCNVNISTYFNGSGDKGRIDKILLVENESNNRNVGKTVCDCKTVSEDKRDVAIDANKYLELGRSESKENDEKLCIICKTAGSKEGVMKQKSKGKLIENNEKQILEKKGVYPVCYFSPLSVLVFLVHDLLICFGDIKKNEEASRRGVSKIRNNKIGEGGRTREPGDLYLDTNNLVYPNEFDDCGDYSCKIQMKESIIGRFFHKKMLGQLNFIPRGNKKCLKRSSSLLSALELFLKEGQTHIPIVSDDDERYTGRTLTLDKCCTYFSRCIAAQVKISMHASLEQVFPSTESNPGEARGGEEGSVGQVPGRISDKCLNKVLEIQQTLNSNCNRDCYECREKDAEENGDLEELGSVNRNRYERDVGLSAEHTASSSLVDLCLSGAISHILLSEEQCLVLVDKVTSKVTAIFTAVDICRFLLSG